MYTEVRNELFTQATYFNNAFMKMTVIDNFFFYLEDRVEVCQNLPVYIGHSLWSDK